MMKKMNLRTGKNEDVTQMFFPGTPSSWRCGEWKNSTLERDTPLGRAQAAARDRITASREENSK